MHQLLYLTGDVIIKFTRVTGIHVGNCWTWTERPGVVFASAVFCPQSTTIHRPVAKFKVPDWGDKVDTGIGFLYRPVRLQRLAGRYDNPMPKSTIYLPFRDYEFGLDAFFSLFL